MQVLTRFRWWALLAALQACDVASTALALATGRAVESNAAGRELMSSYGQPAAYAVKAVGIALVMLALWHYRARRWARVVLACAICVTALAVVNNVGWLVRS